MEKLNYRNNTSMKQLLEETPEAYYWIGFIFADGYFQKQKDGNNYQLQVLLSI